MEMTRTELTNNQLAKLEKWEAEGKPTACIKLGYSTGSRGNGNFHSTWAFRENGKIIRYFEDSRSTWRRMIKKYGSGEVRTW